jgi:hypothetical protein
MRRYLALYVAFTTLFGAVLPAAINFIVDPYQYFHRAWYEPRLSSNERWQLPGLARAYAYDTIILGTSMAQNYYPSTVEAALGGHVLKLAMSGSSVHEQALLFDAARRTGQVKRVLWSLDESQCMGAPDRVNPSVVFPRFLYEGGAAAWGGYLLNASVLQTSIEIVRDLPPRRSSATLAVPDDFNSFDKAYRFASDRALAEYESTVAAAPAPPVDIAEMLRSCDTNVVKTIAAHPEIAFDVIVPPYSILLWKAEQARNPERLRQRLEFSGMLLRRLVALPNARVFDFRDVTAITHDLDRYKDMSHFDVSVNRTIVESIAAGRRRVDPADPLASLRRLEAQIAAYRVPTGPAQAQGN